LLARCKLGTITNPPPTPSNPDNSPANAPVDSSRQVQRAVQNNLDVVGLMVHAGGGVSLLSICSNFAYCQLRSATLISIPANSPLSRGSGNQWANITPNGAQMIPSNAISNAVLYLTKPWLNPCKVPIDAAVKMASKAMGAACCKLSPKLNTSNGIANIAPPAPVRAKMHPTSAPKPALIKLISDIKTG